MAISGTARLLLSAGQAPGVGSSACGRGGVGVGVGMAAGGVWVWTEGCLPLTGFSARTAGVPAGAAAAGVSGVAGEAGSGGVGGDSEMYVAGKRPSSPFGFRP